MVGRRGIVLGLAAVGGAYGAISYVFSDKLIGGQFLPPDEEIAFADFGLPEPEPVTITNGPTELAAWYFRNPRPAGCAAIVLHGFTGNKAQMLGPAATLFFERGCDLLLYDLRGHGASSRGLLSYGAHDKADELAAADWLMTKTGVDPSGIGLWGVSYGAATSLQAAAARPGFAFVVADASYSSVADIASVQAEAQFGAWARVFVPGALLISGLRGGFDPAEASPVAAVRGLATPVLLIHSTTDAFTPATHSEAIYAASDHAHTRLILTTYGAPHGASFWTDPRAYTAYVDDFLAELVPGFGAPRA